LLSPNNIGGLRGAKQIGARSELLATENNNLGRMIARHPRSYEREDTIFDPLHYLALLGQSLSETARTLLDAGGCSSAGDVR